MSRHTLGGRNIVTNNKRKRAGGQPKCHVTFFEGFFKQNFIPKDIKSYYFCEKKNVKSHFRGSQRCHKEQMGEGGWSTKVSRDIF